MGSKARQESRLLAIGVPGDHLIEVGNACDVLEGAGDDLSDALYVWTGLGNKDLAIRQINDILGKLSDAVNVIAELEGG
jgi:hypothetical protein